MPRPGRPDPTTWRPGRTAGRRTARPPAAARSPGRPGPPPRWLRPRPASPARRAPRPAQLLRRPAGRTTSLAALLGGVRRRLVGQLVADRALQLVPALLELVHALL